jgi:hypothetical protein
MTNQFTVNGNIWQYKTDFYDATPILESIEYNDKKTEGCGNPWNFAGGDREQIKKYGVQRNTSPDISDKPAILIDYIKSDAIKEELIDWISADCWLVYVTDDKRNPIKTYFNSFTEAQGKPKCSDPRDFLIDDPIKLIEDLNNDSTVYIIMGSWFVDVTYKKVPGVNLYTRVVTHYKN